MKTDPRLAMLDHSSAARVGGAFFSGLCGIHDRLEKVLWALRPEKAGCPFMTKNGTPFTPAILASFSSSITSFLFHPFFRSEERRSILPRNANRAAISARIFEF